MPYHSSMKPKANKPKTKVNKPNSKPKSKTVKLPKPMSKPKKELTKGQKQLMKEHKVHHTKAHMSEMRKLMKKGFCFQQAHDITMKKIGK